MSGLPQRLREEMEEADLNQSELARLSGVERTRIIRILQDERVDGITAAVVVRLALALKVSVDWLLTGRPPRQIVASVDATAPPEVQAAFIESLADAVAKRIPVVKQVVEPVPSEKGSDDPKSRSAKSKR